VSHSAPSFPTTTTSTPPLVPPQTPPRLHPLVVEEEEEEEEEGGGYYSPASLSHQVYLLKKQLAGERRSNEQLKGMITRQHLQQRELQGFLQQAIQVR